MAVDCPVEITTPFADPSLQTHPQKRILFYSKIDFPE